MDGEVVVNADDLRIARSPISSAYATPVTVSLIRYAGGSMAAQGV
jgi:hypothetical protein